MWFDELVRMKKASGQTTEEITFKSGVPVGTLNKIFAGHTKAPQLETVKAIVYSMGYKLDDLFTDTPSANSSPVPINATETELMLVRAYYALSDKTREKINDALVDVFQRSNVSPNPNELTDGRMHTVLICQSEENAPSEKGGVKHHG